MSKDLVEELIFNAYKEKNLKNARTFKKEVYDNYKYEASSDLYKRIINYQVNKYGEAIQGKGETNYVKHFYLKGRRTRESQKYYVKQQENLDKFIERVENEKDKRKKTNQRNES